MAAIGDRGQKRQHTESDRGGAEPGMIKDGRYITTRKGLHICPAFQAGTCGGHVHGRCPVDRSMGHQCNRCLSDQHGGDTGACSKSVGGAAPGGQSKGKGKNKGKGSAAFQGSWNGSAHAFKGGKGGKGGKGWY